MAEPQPANIKEGDQTPAAIPSSSEDRKTAAALSNLDSTMDNGTATKQADSEALGKAMKGLNVKGDTAAGAQSLGPNDRAPSKAAVKPDPAEVTLLAQQLDVPKAKAMELLRAHDADVVKAITAWFHAV